jgi:hypothetical protein
MSLSERIAAHLRGNVVGYVALFVALSGTAVALPGHKAVKDDDIAPGAVTAKAIHKAAVKHAKLANGAVSSQNIVDGSVVAADLGASSVTDSELADDAVTRQKILAGAINGGKLANGSVDSQKVNDGSLQAIDFGNGQLSDGFVTTTDGGSFTTQRAGRLYVSATFVTGCTSGTCTYKVQINGVDVPGASISRDSSTAGEQLTLVGVTGNFAAGTYPATIVETGTGATSSSVTIAGVLLQ